MSVSEHFYGFFKKPNILYCKTEHDLICDNTITSMNLITNGWGWISIKSTKNSKWPGIIKYCSITDNNLLFLAPTGKELRITMYNPFGKSNILVSGAIPNNLLAQITPPKYLTFSRAIPSISEAIVNTLNLPKNVAPLNSLKINNLCITKAIYLHNPLKYFNVFKFQEIYVFFQNRISNSIKVRFLFDKDKLI